MSWRLFAGMLGGRTGRRERVRGYPSRSAIGLVVLVCAFGLWCGAALAAGPPTVEEEYATDVTSTSATLVGVLNPEGSETTYRFEYGPSASYGSSTSEAAVGSGSAGVSVRVQLQGLSVATPYHYRVVASSAEGVAYGPDHTFTTQTAGGELSLLDGREWELVTPPDKHGANLLPIFEGVVQAAEDGHAITYVTFAPTELEPEGNGLKDQIFSSRHSAGAWSSKDVATPHNQATGALPGAGFEYRYFSPDLSLAIVQEQPGPFTALSSDTTEPTPYVRRNAECEISISTCYTPLLTPADVAEGTKFGELTIEFVDATPDLSHIFIFSSMALTATPGDTGGLYEWSKGQLRIVGWLPEDEGGGPGEIPYLGLRSGSDYRNAVSKDASRIFWHGWTESLYVRDMVKHETLKIADGRQTSFQIANVEGSRVFFQTERGALEVCEIGEVAGKLACETTQLAPTLLGTVLGTSDDGSYVYFVSNDTLAPGATAGSPNLYVDRRTGGGWTPELIAVLSPADAPDWAPNLEDLTARVTPNGRWLAFMSQRGLTGYDTRDVATGQEDEEVYLYDATAKHLTCVSCNPTGARPTGTLYGNGNLLAGGDRLWPQEAMLAANIPGWTAYSLITALYQSRYLSNDGRMFFNSGDALVPQDVNGTWDVYEYEPPGVGSCTNKAPTFSASTGGCVDLVTSGGSPNQSAFLDASETGDDVFFMTTSHLAPQDFDTSQDVYDAHVCSTNVPCAAASVSPPPCDTGDSCKAAPTPQPSTFGAPASATFAGVGNVRASSKAVKRRLASRAHRLARALKACHRKKSKHRRVACERKARRRYEANKATRGSK